MSGEGFLDDYANVAHGLLELHVATGELRWLHEARRLALLAVELFGDPRHGGFFLAPIGGEELVARTKDLDDNPIPSGNSMLAHVLLRLARIWGDDELELRAVSVLRLVEPMLGRAPGAFGWALCALDLWLAPPRELAIVGPVDSPVARAALAPFAPTTVVAVGPADGVPLLEGKGLVEGEPAAYVCERFACRAPVTDAEELSALSQRSSSLNRLTSLDMTTIEQTGAEDVAWDLSDLYASGDDPRIGSDFAEAEAATAAFRERYYGKVADLSAAELAAAIDERERIESIATRALYFAHLEFSTNMADTARGALVSKLGEKAAGLETQLLFFGLEWAAIDDEPAAAILADPALDHWRHWLASQRVFRPYILTEPEEKILTEKSVSGVTAWSRLYEEVLGAMRVDLPGAEEPVSLETAMAKLYATDRDVRRGAAGAVTDALQPGLRTRTSIFNTILVDKWIDDRLRGYPTWITSRNLSNETTDEAVQALIDAATSRYDVPQRYYRLKAKLLGLDRLEVLRPVRPRRRGRVQDVVGRGAERRRRGVRRLLERGGGCRRAVLRRGLDRRPRATRQAPRRLLRDERPRRAPVRVHELHG